jgi:hypothetical protein
MRLATYARSSASSETNVGADEDGLKRHHQLPHRVHVVAPHLMPVSAP